MIGEELSLLIDVSFNILRGTGFTLNNGSLPLIYEMELTPRGVVSVLKNGVATAIVKAIPLVEFETFLNILLAINEATLGLTQFEWTFASDSESVMEESALLEIFMTEIIFNTQTDALMEHSSEFEITSKIKSLQSYINTRLKVQPVALDLIRNFAFMRYHTYIQMAHKSVEFLPCDVGTLEADTNSGAVVNSASLTAIPHIALLDSITPALMDADTKLSVVPSLSDFAAHGVMESNDELGTLTIHETEGIVGRGLARADFDVHLAMIIARAYLEAEGIKSRAEIKARITQAPARSVWAEELTMLADYLANITIDSDSPNLMTEIEAFLSHAADMEMTTGVAFESAVEASASNAADMQITAPFALDMQNIPAHMSFDEPELALWQVADLGADIRMIARIQGLNESFISRAARRRRLCVLWLYKFDIRFSPFFIIGGGVCIS